MDIFSEDYQQFISLLNTNKVEYLLVGGIAVNFHGYQRSTGDMDVWIKPSKENGIKLVAAIKDFGFDTELIKEYDYESTLTFSLRDNPLQIDIMTRLVGLNFDEAYSHRTETMIDKLKIVFIHFNDLIINKMTSGRPKDQADIQELQKIINRKEQNK